MAKRLKSGLTVLETLIAVTIFAVGVMSLFSIFPVSAKAARQSIGHLAAVNLAERELEFSRAQAYDAVQNRSQDYDIVIESNGATNNLVFQTFTEANEIRTGLKHVKVVVRWTEGGGTTRETSLETYVPRLQP